MPVIVDRDADVLRLVQVPGLQRAEVRRVLDDHVIAGIDEDLPDEIQRLLRAGGDEDVVGPDGRAVAAGVARDHLAQEGDSLPWCCTGAPAGPGPEDRAAGLVEAGHRKELRRRQAAGERDDARLLGQLQQLPDLRPAHAVFMRSAYRSAHRRIHETSSQAEPRLTENRQTPARLDDSDQQAEQNPHHRGACTSSFFLLPDSSASPLSILQSPRDDLDAVPNRF
jgi:hypothetical protein